MILEKAQLVPAMRVILDHSAHLEKELNLAQLETTAQALD